MRLIVLADVLKFEALRQIEVELYGRQLPEATDGVLDLDVDLRAVEGRFAFHPLERNPALAESVRQCSFGTRPVFVRTEIALTRVVAFN